MIQEFSELIYLPHSGYEMPTAFQYRGRGMEVFYPIFRTATKQNSVLERKTRGSVRQTRSPVRQTRSPVRRTRSSVRRSHLCCCLRRNMHCKTQAGRKYWSFVGNPHPPILSGLSHRPFRRPLCDWVAQTGRSCPNRKIMAFGMTRGDDSPIIMELSTRAGMERSLFY